MEQEGTPFGRYRLIKLIGRGGMGDVWRALDTETHRMVALKVLPANLANDPTFTRAVEPDSRSARVSPTQRIGRSWFLRAAITFLLMNSSVSAKRLRRSLWPRMT